MIHKSSFSLATHVMNDKGRYVVLNSVLAKSVSLWHDSLLMPGQEESGAPSKRIRPVLREGAIDL